jgi:hypothetical protein
MEISFTPYSNQFINLQDRHHRSFSWQLLTCGLIRFKAYQACRWSASGISLLSPCHTLQTIPSEPIFTTLNRHY